MSWIGIWRLDKINRSFQLFWEVYYCTGKSAFLGLFCRSPRAVAVSAGAPELLLFPARAPVKMKQQLSNDRTVS